MAIRLILACYALLLGACLSGTASSEDSPTTAIPLQTNPVGSGTTTPDEPRATEPEAGPPESTAADASSSSCDEHITFDHAPVDLEAVEYLVPFGLMTGSHVTPVDHQYFQNFLQPEREIDVYSPAEGRVVSIQHFGTPVSEDPVGVVDDFRIEIEHACSISSIFIHIDELIPRLAALDPGVGDYAQVDVPVGPGELLGTFTQNVDYNVVDLDYVVDGLVEPGSYAQEPWKIHVPDTFDYFTTDIREKMERLSLRSAEPRAGRFAYDIDGTLVGNWFLEGTDGYGGIDPDRYWAGHLSFVYDHLDPTTIVVSIGTYEGRSEQFAVRGNGPDPANVKVDTGLVVYELVDWDYYEASGERWDRMSHATDIRAVGGEDVRGVVAVQLIDQREIIVDVLPGRDASDFEGFGDDAVKYTR